ncbi:MAG: NAD(P)H-dependent oxidoreductase [Acetatifactor sp.]
MNVFVVYCHPSENSFTHTVKESFVKGLADAGHSYEISDLYADNFHPVMSEEEYIREGFYHLECPLAEDVIREQEKINRADSIVFIYPDFWTASPAMLEGWFQRVWTYGFAYGNTQTMKRLKKAVFLLTMGGSLQDEVRRVQLEAMKTVMIGDRIRDRAEKCEVYAFDEMTRGYGNDENREKRIVEFSKKAYDLAVNIDNYGKRNR